MARYVKQIKRPPSSLKACTVKIVAFDAVVDGPFFSLDDYGVLISAYRMSAGSTSSSPIVTNSSYGAAIANLDLDSVRLFEQGPDCLAVIFTCKSGECVRRGDNCDSQWSTYVNSREQADALVSGLRAIVRYSPDGFGEIH